MAKSDPDPKPRHVIDVEDDAEIPLEIDPALVEFIILKARAFDVKTAPVEPDPGSNATDDGGRDVLEDYPGDDTETELRDAIEPLSEDAAIDLVAAMLWLGRGDYSRAEWQEARVAATERSGAPLADYLMGEPNLGDFPGGGADRAWLRSAGIRAGIIHWDWKTNELV